MCAALGIGAFLAMNVMAFSAIFYTERAASDAPIFRLFRWLQLAFSLPAVLLLGFPVLKNAARGGMRAGMDLLIVAGVSASVVLSMRATIAGSGHVYYETAVATLVIVTLGRYLEASARATAARDLGALLGGVPDRATLVREEGREESVSLAALRPGDRVLVRPGEAIPVDGEVVAGEAAIDAAALTGESRPSACGPGARVFAGSITLDGALTIAVQAAGENRLLARLARLVEEARRSRAPIERAADRVSRAFLGIALALAAAAFALRAGTDPRDAIERALAVLVVACPCSLGIATPLALAVAISRAAREGAVVRSGAVLEALASVRAAVFDKTGTLTSGRPAIVDVATAPGVAPAEAVRVAAALERTSSHPIARAFAAEAERRGVAPPLPAGLRARPGLGIEGELQGERGRVLLGSRRFLDREGVAVPESLDRSARSFEAAGRSVVFLASGADATAVFALGEEIREGAAPAIQALRRAGIEVAALTGDSEAAGLAVGRALGIPVRAGLLPDEKVCEIARREAAGTRCLMIGDGLNDAPALAAASVGIAIEGALDLVREAAPIVLYRSDLRAIPSLVALARATLRTIRWNLVWSFFYNAVGMALAATGRLHPALAAAAMLLSSLFVIRQSLALRAARLGAPAAPASAAAGTRAAGDVNRALVPLAP